MMIKIQIDGRIYETEPGKNLLETCLALGFDLPYFCYHPAMGSVGACRQCAVKRFRDASDTKGRIIMSCMEPATDGMIISIQDPEAAAFRASVIESLMLNHPHDCPVCDEGGECHLQDMTVMTGHTYRRTGFPKRTYVNQDLGPFIHHEMNRCIQCYRCVRFYKDYAGGRDFGVFGSHDHVYFGRFEEGILENEFSGNLAEVCPTGVFTDKTLRRHFTRKWDLSNTPSVCVHCSVGCNTIAGERYGTLRRILNRYNGSVNGYFLCDRGRFGYEFVNTEQRIREPLMRSSREDPLRKADPAALAARLNSTLTGNTRVIGIGSPRASLEANYALSVVVGRQRFFNGLSKIENDLVQLAIRILKGQPAHTPSLREMERADAVLILGEDLTNTAPMVALAVRQAARTAPVAQAVDSGIPEWHDAAVRDRVQDQKSPVFIASPCSTKLDEIARSTFRSSPEGIARLGFAVASHIDRRAPGIADGDKEQTALATEIAASLMQAKNPLILTGTHMGHSGLLQAAANIAWALNAMGIKAGLGIVHPECNTLGIGLMEDKSLEEAITLAEKNEVDTAVILENDLFRRMGKSAAEKFLGGFKHVIVLDQLITGTSERADLVLPAGTFSESEGTLVNHEGRAQRYYRVLPPDQSVKESWRQLSELVSLSCDGRAAAWDTFDQVVRAMTDAHPVFTGIRTYMPDADFRMMNARIKRQTLRFSGRTAMNANVSVIEPRPPQDPDSPLAFSMEGAEQQPPSSLVPFYWIPGWNSGQAVNFYLDAPNGSLKGGDPGVRLINSGGGKEVTYFTLSPQETKQGQGDWLLVPVHAIFGSEELSSRSPAIAERIPRGFIRMNGRDAAKVGKHAGDVIRIHAGETWVEGNLELDERIPAGVAGVPALLPGDAYIEFPCTGRF
jgi:NADH-quinone oxidoreductase subunit G